MPVKTKNLSTNTCLAACLLGLAPYAFGQSRLHTATPSNTYGNFTYLNESATDPNRVFMVTPFLDAASSGDPSPLGIWFTGYNWALYNEDRAGLPTPAKFFVDSAAPDAWNFTHQSTPANTPGLVTYIDSPTCNYRPEAILHVAHQFSYTTGYNNSQLAVWYDSARGQWGIFKQDGSHIQTGMVFDVVVDPHIAGRENSDVISMTVFNPWASSSIAIGRRGALFNQYGLFGVHVYVTARFSYDLQTCLVPSGCNLLPGDVQQPNRAMAVRYDAARRQWMLVTEDGSPLPPYSSFNVTVLVDIPG